MERIICLVFGYLFGLFQTGYLYGKLHKIDIRQHGSGNSGSTNVLRVMGVKAGATVFMGDFLKTVIPCFIVRIFYKDQTSIQYLMILYTGLGVILGHNYPFYMNFKGGKGIAATAGILVSLDWTVTLICLIAFVLIVAVTRFVSLGSLVVVSIFLALMIFEGSRGTYGLAAEYLTEFYLVSACVTALAFWKHRANIVRLLHGTENKIGSGKK